MAGVIGQEPDGVYEKRWTLFRVRPGDLLTLLQLMARHDTALKAEALPPDVRVIDAFYDREQEQCALMLESAFYSPVQARLFKGRWSGGWDELVFSLGGEEEEAEPPVRPRHLVGEVRWEAYLIPPERIAQLLQTLASGERYNLPPLPPDTRLMDAFFDAERNAFILFLESSFFELSDVEGEGANQQVGMPERHLNLTRGESDL
jgi:hypothetical protein